ncbi:MAG: hypothetical protein JWR33_228 [Naasia sp.]|jgi:pimeloyl-ACP methyl ester carboxylesterase|uniref:alpha/beta fold hydrolase n=1 Tax=Naasia sp. TaxID=2546198 RepID=UPI00260E9177|nr:alpha/beta hydrolase [Naasia sp.]MCU1569487.1 hypothetical protein [Naasia sp.]
MVALPRYASGPGAGRPALLVHGLSSDAAGWWRVQEHLVGAGWRVTAVDLRGHGRAPRADSYGMGDYAADLAEVRDEGGPWDVVLGHSLGASSSLLAAVDRPGWSRRLVLIDPVVSIDASGLASIGADALAEKSAATLESIAAAHPRWHRRDIEAKVAALERVDAAAIALTVADPSGWQLRDALASVPVPTLLIAADPDLGGLLDPGHAGEAAAANSRITAASVAGAGHSVHREDADALLSLVDRFLG